MKLIATCLNHSKADRALQKTRVRVSYCKDTHLELSQVCNMAGKVDSVTFAQGSQHPQIKDSEGISLCQIQLCIHKYWFYACKKDSLGTRQ